MSDFRRLDEFGFMPVNKRGVENPCFECSTFTKGLHHVVPVSLGGTKQIPLCENCHNKVHKGLINSVLIKEGIRKFREKGGEFGAPIKLSLELILKIKQMRNENKTFRQISELTGLSLGTVHKASLYKG